MYVCNLKSSPLTVAFTGHKQQQQKCFVTTCEKTSFIRHLVICNICPNPNVIYYFTCCWESQETRQQKSPMVMCKTYFLLTNNVFRPLKMTQGYIPNLTKVVKEKHLNHIQWRYIEYWWRYFDMVNKNNWIFLSCHDKCLFKLSCSCDLFLRCTEIFYNQLITASVVDLALAYIDEIPHALTYASNWLGYWSICWNRHSQDQNNNFGSFNNIWVMIQTSGNRFSGFI